MSDQDFKDQILSAMADIKRSNEQAIVEVKQSVAEVKQSVAEVKQSNEHAIAEVKQSIEEIKRTNERAIGEVKQSIEDVKHDTKRIDNGLRNVETDVAWIKGKLEGSQELISNKDAKSAIWIALGSAVAAIISLIKSFW